jgi:hypothetical protein
LFRYRCTRVVRTGHPLSAAFNPAFHYDGDGTVSSAESFQFRKQFGETLA